MSNLPNKKIIFLGDIFMKNYLSLEDFLLNVNNNKESCKLQENLRLLNYQVTDYSIYQAVLDDIGNNSLSLLENHHSKSEMIIISIGSKDIYNNIFRSILGIDSLISSVLTYEYIYIYNRLISKILEKSKKLVLVTLYSPYMGDNPELKYFLKSIIDKWSDFVISTARSYNIAVLDLSNIVNPCDISHYDSSKVHLSDKMAKIITEHIDNIYKNYSGFYVYGRKDLS